MDRKELEQAIRDGKLSVQEKEQAIRDGLITVNELIDIEGEAGAVQISLAEYLEKAEGHRLSEILSSSSEKIRAFGKVIQKQMTASFKGLDEIIKQLSRLMPYVNILKEVYPEDSPLWKKPVTLITTPANVYIVDRDLEGATPERIEQERSNYIAFFNAYYAEWQLLEGKYGDSLDISAAHNAVWNVLTDKGLLREYEEAPLQGELNKTITLIEGMEGYATLLHRPGLDEIALLNGKRMEIKKHEETGRNSITSGRLTIQEDFGKEISLLPSKKKQMNIADIEERNKQLDLLFQELAKRLSSVAAMKWLDMCAIQLGAQNKYGTTKLNTLVVQPLEKMMELWGIPVTKASLDKFRRTIRDVQEAFYSLSFEYEENVGGGKKEPMHLRILQKRSEVKNSVMYARFTEEIADYLCHGYPGQFPLSLLKVDERNPNIYAIGRYLANRYSNIINQQQGTADIISVKSLLANAPGIPTYEEVEAAGARHWKPRIMKPFKDALDKLNFLTWEYCNAKKAPLTEEQKANFDYETFIECYVHYTLLDPKDYKPLIAARAEKKAADAAKREARATAKKRAEGATK